MDTSDLIEEHFPYDGPHTPTRVGDAASCVDDLTRYLANATYPNKPVTEWAPAIRRVAGQLSNGVGHLPQVLGQLARALDKLADDPSMFDDRYSNAFPASDTARSASDELRLAAQQAELLYARLAAAGGHLYHLGHDIDENGRKRR